MSDKWEPVAGVFLKSKPMLPLFSLSVDLWPLITTIIGALAGAWLGAWAAQKIAKAEKDRDEITREFRSLNSAMIMSYNIANTAMVLKRQYLRDLKNSYERDIEKYEALKNSPPPHRLEIEPRLINLGATTTPITVLQQIVLDKLSSNSSATNTISALASAISNLNDSITRHNSFISLFQQSAYPPGYSFEHMYLGIPVNGNVNNIYGDTLRALYSYNEDVIFFAIKLNDDLREAGLKILPMYRRLTRRIDSDIPDIDLSEPILQNLVPQHEEYESWLSGFKLKPTSISTPKWHVRPLIDRLKKLARSHFKKPYK